MLRCSVFLILLLLCNYSLSEDRSDYISCVSNVEKLYQDVVRYGNLYVEGKDVFSSSGFVDWIYKDHEAGTDCIENLGVSKNFCTGNYYSPFYKLDEAESLLLLSVKYMTSSHEYYDNLGFTKIFYNHEKFSEKFGNVYLSKKIPKAKEALRSVRTEVSCLFPEE